MAKTDIGGFFLSLGLKPDKNSFDAGQKLVGGMTDSFSKLIGVARNAAVVVAAQKAITGAISQSGEELQKLHTAERLGVAAEQLNVWKAAAKIAGANADSLVSSMSKIANIQARLRWDAAGLESYQKELARLKISYEEIKDLSADKALEYIFKKAETMKGEMTTAEISSALEDIAGSGAADLYVELLRQGKSFDQFFAGASATQYQTNEGMNNAANFAAEMTTLKTAVDSISKSIGNNIAGALVDPLNTVNKWLTDNKQNISDGIVKIGTATEKIVSKVADWWDNNGDTVVDILTGIASTVSLIMGKLFDAFSKDEVKSVGSVWLSSMKAATNAVPNMVKGAKEGGIAGFGKAYIDSFLGVMVDPLKDWWENRKMKDGIMRPDGTITQVAPDDWVFAARNVSDLAKAFIPAGMTGGGTAEYSIVQNFTITGSNDIPQVIKQQAYRGTQEGLMAAMEQSSRRLQMMSGTR
jgi:hypothetical protein